MDKPCFSLLQKLNTRSPYVLTLSSIAFVLPILPYSGGRGYILLTDVSVELHSYTFSPQKPVLLSFFLKYANLAHFPLLLYAITKPPADMWAVLHIAAISLSEWRKWGSNSKHLLAYAASSNTFKNMYKFSHSLESIDVQYQESSTKSRNFSVFFQYGLLKFLAIFTLLNNFQPFLAQRS